MTTDQLILELQKYPGLPVKISITDNDGVVWLCDSKGPLQKSMKYSGSQHPDNVPVYIIINGENNS